MFQLMDRRMSAKKASKAPKIKAATICGYELTDIRKTLCDMIDRRDGRAAYRWTAELVATPAAVGSLWASYWLAWTVGAGPSLAILLQQGWADIVEAAKMHTMTEGGTWISFRNDPEVRGLTTELTTRLLGQIRHSPVVWPSKDIVLFDISTLRDGWAAGAVPTTTDSAALLSVWQRSEDAMDYRFLAGAWMDCLQRGDLRLALSAMLWTFLTPAQQGKDAPLKCAERGPAALPVKCRASPLWFWLEVGGALIKARPTLHRGWFTFHKAVVSAFREHYKRWTATERMKMLLAWVQQIRASFQPQPESIWSAAAVTHTTADIDRPYQEIAAELADPESVIEHIGVARPTVADQKADAASKTEAKMAAADAQIMAALGLTEADM
jgi:hypothetical protein